MQTSDGEGAKQREFGEQLTTVILSTNSTWVYASMLRQLECLQVAEGDSDVADVVVDCKIRSQMSIRDLQQ